MMNRRAGMIDSIDDMEKAALQWGLLPFFRNDIRGLSIQEMAVPGALFGDEEGCWEWKGPVIQRMTTAYGKFFNRKAGFVSLELLPDFVNYRRWRYPVAEGSVDGMVLDIIRANEGLTSTELKKLIFGSKNAKRELGELPALDASSTGKTNKSLEGPLQRLQMGAHLLIADFQYKLTRRGEPYGWGVALYSTPEIWLPDVDYRIPRSPMESFERLAEHMHRLLPGVPQSRINKLIE